MAELVKDLTDSKAFLFTSFCIFIQLSLTVPSNEQVTTLEAAIPLSESSDDLKPPPYVELKSCFLKFSPWDLVLPVSVYLEARVKPVRVGEMPVLLIPVSSTANEIPDICWYKAREKGTKGRILLLI